MQVKHQTSSKKGIFMGCAYQSVMQHFISYIKKKCFSKRMDERLQKLFSLRESSSASVNTAVYSKTSRLIPCLLF